MCLNFGIQNAPPLLNQSLKGSKIGVVCTPLTDYQKYYIIARKIVAILTSQNNICFEEVYLSQRNSEQKYFKTGICKIFDSYENYSIRQWHKVIPIFSVFDYIPNLIDGIVNGKVNSLLELLPEDNKMVNRISIKNVQDLCTALEVSYQLDDKRKRDQL